MMRRGRSRIFPWPRALVDLYFAAQRYWWAGQERHTGEFTTYTLNGSTFGDFGLTPTAAIDWTLALAGVGTVVPGSWMFAVKQAADPGALRCPFQLDDGTANERVTINQGTSGAIGNQIFDGGVSQANNLNSTDQPNFYKLGGGTSFATNAFRHAVNGSAAADTSGTLPTVTHLRIGKNTAADSQFNGSIIRLTIFDFTQAALGDVFNLSSIATFDPAYAD
jgi:hypothetical protein